VLAVRGAPPFVSDLNALHTDRSPAMQALAELDRLVDRPLVPWVVSRRKRLPKELADRFAALTPALDALVADGTLVAHEPPTLALPTRCDQQAAFAALAGSTATRWRARAREGRSASASRRRARLDREMLRATRPRGAREVVTLDELARLGASDLVADFFRRTGATWSAAGYVFASGGMFAEFRQRTSSDPPDRARGGTRLRAHGFQWSPYELTSRVRRDFRGVTALADGGGRPARADRLPFDRGTLLSLVPVGVAFLWLLAAMQLRGLPFNVLNVVLLPMLVGLGVDYGIHLVFDGARDRRRARLDARGDAADARLRGTTVAGLRLAHGGAQPRRRIDGRALRAGIAFTLIRAIVVLAPLLRLVMRIASRSRDAAALSGGAARPVVTARAPCRGRGRRGRGRRPFVRRLARRAGGGRREPVEHLHQRVDQLGADDRSICPFCSRNRRAGVFGSFCLIVCSITRGPAIRSARAASPARGRRSSRTTP